MDAPITCVSYIDNVYKLHFMTGICGIQGSQNAVYAFYWSLFYWISICLYRSCNDQIYYCVERNWNIQGSSPVPGKNKNSELFFPFSELVICWTCCSIIINFLLNQANVALTAIARIWVEWCFLGHSNTSSCTCFLVSFQLVWLTVHWISQKCYLISTFCSFSFISFDLRRA